VPLTLPQRDSDGFALLHDHPEIMNEDLLIRRISKTAAKESVVPAKSGGQRLSSAILTASSKEQDPYEGLSVDIETVALELGLNPKKFMITDEFLGAVGLSAKCFRNETLLVGYDPQPDNECHGQVWGKLRPKRRKRLMQYCSWYIEISGVLLQDT
jgi:hypothetical protein